MGLTLGELAEKVGGEVVGAADTLVTGVATLQNAGPSAISFCANPSYRNLLSGTRAAAVILRRADLELCPVAALVTDQPYLVYARIAALLHPQPAFAPGIHPSAVVAGTARVDPSAWIGPHSVVEDKAVIGAGVFVGPNCVVGPSVVVGPHGRLIAHVTLCHATQIGARVLLHPGVVIGSDGFGLANEDGRWLKVPQLGRVIVGDDVEIGANTTVDRGALDDTLIGDGVKLDNLIQVAHNVQIGAHTAIAGCAGIAGSATIGAHCAIGGGVGIVGHIRIADHVQITGMSFVTKSIDEPGVYSSGMPAETNQTWHKNIARFRHLDDMARRLRAVEKKLDHE
ncbi:MAG: UDP-3-O-(3-hydroxymyristoyl)glucosamine N-acyltransferase [Gammaproteobacteria bacterium]